MSFKITPFFLLAVLVAGCLWKYEVIRNYSIGKTYSAKSGDVLIEYKEAKTRTLASGVPHVLKTKEKVRIYLESIQKNQTAHFLLGFRKEIILRDGQFSGEIERTTIQARLPSQVKIFSFVIGLISIEKNTLRYRILEEPQSLRESGKILPSSDEKNKEKLAY